MKGRAGFTLLEALVSCAILGSLMLAACAVFELGMQGFRLGTTRLDLQGELRRVLTPLRKELRNSSYLSVSMVSPPLCSVQSNPPQPTPLEAVRRDAICFNGLRKWVPGSYDVQNGLPKWDCYVVYFATQDSPDGTMVRMLFEDNTVDTITRPLSLAEADLTTGNTKLIDGEVRRLSAQVMEFAVELNPAEQVVQLHLRIRGKAGRSLGRQTTAEILEVRTAVRPANTWPRL